MKSTVKSTHDDSAQTPSGMFDTTAPIAGGARIPPADAGSDPTVTDRQITIVLVALTAAVYLRTVAPDVLAGDAGEFHFAAWRLGLSHPTGYPTYQILGHLWQKALALFGISPALALNAFSGVAGAISLGLLYNLMRRWLPAGSKKGHITLAQAAAVFTALLFGWNLTYWSQNLIAEVYTLHVIFVLLIFGAAIRLERPQPEVASLAGAPESGTASVPSGRRLVVLAGLVGLSLTHHGMTLFLLPALLLYLHLRFPPGSVRPWYRQSPATWLAILVAGLLPLLLYLYIPLRSGPDASPWYHQSLGDTVLTLYPGGWDAFAQFISGRSISVGFNDLAGAWAQLGFGAWLWRIHFTLAGLVVTALGLFVLIRRRATTVLVLTGGYALTQQLFNLFYNIEDILVYYIPLYLVGAIWAGFGAHALATAAWRAPADPPLPDHTVAQENIAKDVSTPPPPVSPQDTQSAPAVSVVSPGEMGWSSRLGWIVMVLLFLLPVSALLNHWELVDQSAGSSARVHWEAILAAQPEPDSILVSNDRDEIVPLFYLQWVENRRQDLTGIFPLIAPDAHFADIGTTVQTALEATESTGQPVYLIKEMAGLGIVYALEPATPPLVRVAGPHRQSPPIIGHHPLGPLELEGYAWSVLEPSATPADSEDETPPNLEIRLYWRVLEPLPADYTTTVQLFDAADKRLAQSDAPPGAPYFPTSLWQPGRQIIETHHLTLPHYPLPDANRPDAESTVATLLLVGMYNPVDMSQLAPPIRITLPADDSPPE